MRNYTLYIAISFLSGVNEIGKQIVTLTVKRFNVRYNIKFQRKLCVLSDALCTSDFNSYVTMLFTNKFHLCLVLKR